MKKLYNARDLGGYPAMGGKITKFGVFVRSELPCELPEEDIQYLKNYGITASVDFRGTWELSQKKSALVSAFPYYHRPLFDDVDPPDIEKILSMYTTVDDQYKDMVETGRSWAKEVLEMAADNQGGFLFHCTGGKDRTGIIACLLLSIAGVSREDIVADYCISEVLLAPSRKKPAPSDRPMNPLPFMAEQMPDMSDFEGSPPKTMQALLDYLDDRYGGVMGYLKDIGVTEKTISKIRDKFLEDT